MCDSGEGTENDTIYQLIFSVRSLQASAGKLARLRRLQSSVPAYRRLRMLLIPFNFTSLSGKIGRGFEIQRILVARRSCHGPGPTRPQDAL